MIDNNTFTGLQIHSRSRSGHRGAYMDFAQSQLGGTFCDARTALTAPGPVFFLMADDGFHQYAGTAILRALMRRKTVGLLFRPGPVVDARNGRQRLKRFILRVLKSVKPVQTLSIVPVDLRPQLGTVVDSWIHDFQLWDLTEDDYKLFNDLRKTGRCDNPEAQAMFDSIMARTDGKPLLVALGEQSLAKGFRILIDAHQKGALEGWSVFIAGRVARGMGAEVAAIEGSPDIILKDGFISDTEMIASYACANAIWCLYDRSYDQASGILGRAVQFGVPVVVRGGSISHALCRAEDMPHCAASGPEDLALALASLPPADPARGAALSERLRNQNIAKLLRVLDQGDTA